MSNFMEDENKVAKSHIEQAKKILDLSSEDKDMDSFINWIKDNYKNYRDNIIVKIINKEELVDFNENYIVISELLYGEIVIGDYIYIEESNYLYQVININKEKDDQFYIKKIGINQN